jgi:hypothetical protein
MNKNTKIKTRAIFAIAFLLIVPVQSFSMNLDQTNTQRFHISNEIKSWTALYYLDVDFTGAQNGDALDWIFIDEIASTDNINVLVLQDKEEEPAFLYYIDENHTKILLEELGEVNMGDPQTLIDFISYGKENYPAERYQLCPFGHANAWYGVCNDDTSGGDIITMDEFQRALSVTNGVDLLCFIGCCQMASLECVYELKEVCEVYVASESSGHQNDWIGMMDEMCGLLDNNNISTVECGEKIVQYIGENQNDNYDTLTISAIRTDKFSNFVNAFEQLCLLLCDNNDQLYENFKSSIFQTKQFDFIQNSFLIDLYDFIEHYLGMETDPDVIHILNKVKTNFSQALIAECHGEKQDGSYGLSLFYSSKDLISMYANYDLDFTADTHWDELLDNHKEKSKNLLFTNFLDQFLKYYPRMVRLLCNLLDKTSTF